MLGAVNEQMSDRASRRMCAGCRNRAERDALVRLVVGDRPPYVAVDLGRRLGGRGVSVHPRRTCVEAAVVRGRLAEGLPTPHEVTSGNVARWICEQFEGRLIGLLVAAQRARAVRLGTDAVQSELRAGKRHVLLFATDAKGRRDELAALAESQGCIVASWGTKAVLGDLFGRPELGVLLIVDDGIAHEVRRCLSNIEALAEDRA